MFPGHCERCGAVPVVRISLGASADSTQDRVQCTVCGGPAAEATPARAPSRPVRRVAVVDAGADMRTAIRRALQEVYPGAACDEFADGTAFVQAAASATARPYDLVVSELELPGTDGLTAVASLRGIERKRRWDPAPVLFFSWGGSATKLRGPLHRLAPSRYLGKESVGTLDFLAPRLRSSLERLLMPQLEMRTSDEALDLILP